SWNLFPCHI
ncbi:asparaginyl-tRNA synthetase domain protein, partial [Vibrio parahaemolyticus EKP-021]